MNQHLPFLKQLPHAATLFTGCVCGHARWKHVAFAHACREAGCGCKWFGEMSEDQGPTTGKPKPATHHS